MNTKAIIASLVLASSSAALAAPGVTVSTAQASVGTPVGSPVVRDHRTDDSSSTSGQMARPSGIYWRDGWHGEPMPQVYRPVTLAERLRFARNGRTSITVGSQAGRFAKLQISAAAGRTFIKQVYVQFDNGQAQVVRNLDRTLSGHESLTLDLDGNRRAIRRIVVYGNDTTMSWQRGGGSFTVTAS
jgi:hypothetical protein